MTAAIYCRVSSQEQAKGWSLDGQYQECRAYCDAQGYRTVRVYREAHSGSDDDRPVFQQMIQHGLQRRFDLIVVWRRDRWARDPVASGFYRRLLKSADVTVESIDHGPEDDDPTTEFMGSIMDAVARLEARQIASRCQMGRVTAAQAGIWPTRPPYGYKRSEDRSLKPHRFQAPLVRRLFHAVTDGATLRDVAADLDVSPRTTAHRLRNPAYRGQATYDGIPVAVPALVDEDTWHAANAALDARRPRPGFCPINAATTPRAGSYHNAGSVRDRRAAS